MAVALGAGALAFLGILSINVLMSGHSRELRGALTGGWIVLCIVLAPLVHWLLER